jgi:Cd2+/Zn2+-exporting ATPase
MTRLIMHSNNCSCSESCSNDIEVKKQMSLYLGVVFFIAGIIFNYYIAQTPSYAVIAVFLIAYMLIGKDILLTAVRNILAGKDFDENFLMSIASIGAFFIGEYPEAVAVMLFYKIGEALQDRAVASSRRSISALLDIRPDKANLKTPEGISVTDAENVQPNDIIIIKAGEKVPLDGVVKKGVSTIDTRALTGESLPQDVNIGSTVLSGSINGHGMLELEVTKRFEESTASRIIELVQNASNKKAKTENFITKFAAYYTPAVVGIATALTIIPPFALGLGSFDDWLNRALVFLVISCPCALVISIPLGFFGGIGAASSKGILIKGSNYLEALNDIDAVIFDKTGTLTTGIFKVTKIISGKRYTQDEVLRYGVYAEYHSTHPIAVSIKARYFADPENTIDETLISELTESAGFGVKARIGDKTILVGSHRLMEEERIEVQHENEVGTVVYVAINGEYAGAIVISDELKADSAKTIHKLHDLGIKKIAMLTGDNRKIGEKIGRELSVDEIYSELLPYQKVEILESILGDRKQQNGSAKKGNVIFVGDGINDAPVLARADIGIAMGGMGSDAAIEASDIVIMNDEPSKVITAIKIAGKTRRIVWQNIVGALTVKGVILLLGALGYATICGAVFADVGVAIIAVMNSVRAGRIAE